MILNQEQLLAIKEGIEQGFIAQGYPLSVRDRWIIDLTIKTTLGFLEKVTVVNK
jgi:hypothetical protein